MNNPPTEADVNEAAAQLVASLMALEPEWQFEQVTKGLRDDYTDEWEKPPWWGSAKKQAAAKKEST